MGYIVNSNQYLFDKTFAGLRIALKLFIKLLVYLPLWFTGYMISTNILQKDDDALAWIGLIILFALLIYQVIFFIKGLIIGLIHERNLLWIPLFILCFSFTCILPVWLVFNNIQPYLYELSPKSGNILTWIASISFGIYVFSRYHYFTNISPAAASLSYQLGISTVSKSFHAATTNQYF